ncbi:MAG: HNH endonuclease [Nitrospira sp.]|nr:HNH endonuclease [Nitrospira sp.]
MKTLRERFWAKVSVGEPDECWDWSGSKTAFGYGVISVDGKLARAHRVSVELDGRMIPHGMVVMHTCDNPSCCNPTHLRVGTQVENAMDMISKKRGIMQREPWRAARGDRNTARLYPELLARGEHNGQAKLTAEDVRRIKFGDLSHASSADIARLFKVSISAISLIRKGENWAHITEATLPPHRIAKGW